MSCEGVKVKQDLVIFEGADGSGKSALYQAFRRATNYQILCIDRWIGSQIVYDHIYGREDKMRSGSPRRLNSVTFTGSSLLSVQPQLRS